MRFYIQQGDTLIFIFCDNKMSGDGSPSPDLGNGSSIPPYMERDIEDWGELRKAMVATTAPSNGKDFTSKDLLNFRKHYVPMYDLSETKEEEDTSGHDLSGFPILKRQGAFPRGPRMLPPTIIVKDGKMIQEKPAESINYGLLLKKD